MKMFATTITNDPTKALWLELLHSALRTILACTIVACTTLYGPEKLKFLFTYPAFSYVTTILVVSEATLGDTIYACAQVLFVTVQVLASSMLTLWAIGPDKFSKGPAAVAVAISAFVVAAESVPLLAKRIAFGQIVIIYVGAVVHGEQTGLVMHPVHVGLSSGLGAFASLLAMLLPFPRLAYYEVGKKCRVYVDNTSERLNLLVDAFVSQQNQAAAELICKANVLARTGVRHLNSIKDYQGSILWEKPHIRFLKPNRKNPGEKMGEIEKHMNGMEIALTSRSPLPIVTIDEELRKTLSSMKEKIGLRLEQARCCVPFDATTAPVFKEEFCDHSSWIPKTNVSELEDLSAFFFLHIMDLLQSDSAVVPSTGKSERSDGEQISDAKFQNNCLKNTFKMPTVKISRERWIFALKCSLSLGFAVLFGLMFSKEQGYWSGLTIAISFTMKRQATFTAANARAQGTAMGSVYGVLCNAICHNSVDLRFLPVLPWIIFTTFLRHSKFYGESGAISAVIGALLILGRKNYHNPKDFAITRLTEACIGLLCFVTMEVLLERVRAATLARSELVSTLAALRDCVGGISLNSTQKDESPSHIHYLLREKQHKVESHVKELEKRMGEARQEPNFWFLPYDDACYRKFLGSVQNMNCLIFFAVYEIDILSQVSTTLNMDLKELESINEDLNVFKEKIVLAFNCLEEVLSVNSLAKFEKELEKNSTTYDAELGIPPNADGLNILVTNKEVVSRIMSSFLQHAKEVIEEVNNSDKEQELKRHTILCLYGFGFCIGSLMREMEVIQSAVEELIAYENPTSQMTLFDVYCKINALTRK